MWLVFPLKGSDNNGKCRRYDPSEQPSQGDVEEVAQLLSGEGAFGYSK